MPLAQRRHQAEHPEQRDRDPAHEHDLCDRHVRRDVVVDARIHRRRAVGRGQQRIRARRRRDAQCLAEPGLVKDEHADRDQRRGEPPGEDNPAGEPDHGHRDHAGRTGEHRPQRGPAPGRLQRGLDVDRGDPGQERQQQPAQRPRQGDGQPRPPRAGRGRGQVEGLAAAFPRARPGGQPAGERAELEQHVVADHRRAQGPDRREPARGADRVDIEHRREQRQQVRHRVPLELQAQQPPSGRQAGHAPGRGPSGPERDAGGGHDRDSARTAL